MDPEEEARQAEARLAALTEPPADPPADPPLEDPQDPLADPPADPPELEANLQDPPADPPLEEPPPPRRGSRTLEARIGGLAAEKRTLVAQLAEAEAELVRLRAAAPGATPPGDPPSPTGDPPQADPQRHEFRTLAEFNAAVQAEAQRRADLADWNRRCNAVEDVGAGQKDLVTGKVIGPERWAAAKRNLTLLDDNGVIPFALLSVALETDAPERVLLALGEDPDRAAELLAMTTVKRAMEIAKMSGPATPKPAARSNAPPPVDPLRGRGAPAAAAEPNDRDSDAEWLKKRNQAIDARRVAEAARQRSMS